MMARILVKVDDGSVEFFEATHFGTDPDGRLVIEKKTDPDTFKIVGLFTRWMYVRYQEE